MRYQEFQRLRDHWKWEHLHFTEFLPEKGYKSESKLRCLHHEKKMSISQIADKFDVTNTTISSWMDRLGVEKIYRNKYKKFKICYTENAPYPALSLNRNKDGRTYIFEHQMVMLAQGYSINDVFGQSNYDIHHLNSHKCDNRPGNLQLIDKTMHGRMSTGNQAEYTESQIYDLLMFVLGLGRFRHTKSKSNPKGPSSEDPLLRGYS
jgi:hypothetical protein